jgi:ABC-2 type transport system ATP-binding protein
MTERDGGEGPTDLLPQAPASLGIDASPSPEPAVAEPAREIASEIASAVPVTPAHGSATAPGPSVLEIRGLTKKYGSVSALSGLELTVRQGEVYGFLGRNGAGKSTTIRILMGITQKTSGTVALFGEAPGKTDLVRSRQRIGYVAQEQNFYGWMSPLGLARFVRAFFPTWDDAEFKRLSNKLELPLDRAVGTFSGGMRVKVALAIALAHRPPLLLLDEPTAGLDPVARREFLEIVRDESKSSGRTTFFSSHLVDEVELVAHRIGIVDGGRCRYEGGIKELGARVRLVTLAAHENLSVPMTAAALTARGLTVLHTDEHDGSLRFFVEADAPERFDALTAEASASEAMGSLTVTPLPLEEIFVAMVRRKTG